MKLFSIKFQKNAISRLNSISRKSSFSRFNNSFFICILWIRSNFRRVFFVNSKNLKMKNSINWFVKSLKYFFFLMMFSFHLTSSSDLKSFETQISLNFIFWFLRLYAINICVEFVDRKNWTKVIKSFFFKKSELVFLHKFHRRLKHLQMIFNQILLFDFDNFDSYWSRQRKNFSFEKNFFFLSLIDLLKETTWSSFHFELHKILFALTINDERILIKQTSDLNWTLSRDFLTTILIKILFALTINDEKIFIISNSNFTLVWLNCEQSTNFDVSLLKRRLFNLKNRHRQKTRFSLFDLQNRVDREF
jgi:hypothetical protein